MSRSLVVYILVACWLLAGCQPRIVHHETACYFPPPTDGDEKGQEEVPPGIFITEMSNVSPRRTEPPADDRSWSERHPFIAKVASGTGVALATTAVVVAAVGLIGLYAVAAGNTGRWREKEKPCDDPPWSTRCWSAWLFPHWG